VSGFEYHRPTSLDQAVALLGEAPDPAFILAGGTDLWVHHKLGGMPIAAVVSLQDIPELDTLAADGEGLVIGAKVTLAQMLTSGIAKERAAVLVDAIHCMANVNVRNAATVVGNICNASPAADTAGPLLALDAEVAVVGPDGERRVPIGEWFISPGSSCIGTREIVTAIHLPAQQGLARYERLANRRNADLALVSTCLRVVRGADGTVSDARVTLGAVTATPRRSQAAESALVGSVLDAPAIQAAAEAAADEASPIDDVRATAWYRVEMVRNLVRRGLQTIAAQGGEA
jgi:aerobic carbon-monoxide dehydrogenase medium subunit